MRRVAVTKNDLDALRAAFAGLRTTSVRLTEMQAAIDALGVSGPGDSDAGPEPPAELIRAATAHAIAAAAFSGLLHRLFTPGGAVPMGAAELTDSAGENA
jgi:hypothetical protein